MERPFDLIVRGGTCVLPWGLSRADLAVAGGRIAAIGDLSGATAERELDAHHLHVFPGVLDTGSHLRDDGGQGLLLGGVTTALDARPHPSTAAALEDKLSRARGRAHCDYAFFLAASEHHLDDLDRLERLPGCAGLSLSLSADDEPLHRGLSRGFRRVTASCEAEPHAEPVEAGTAVDLWRGDDVPRALHRFLAMARRAGRRVHLQHVRGADELALLAGGRDLATVACAVDDLAAGSSGADALWQAIRGGHVEVVHTGAAPTSAGPHPLLPQLLEHAHAGRLGLVHVADLLAAAPARIYNIARKGRLALGFDADLVLVDLAAEHVHAGARLHGWPVATVLRGDLVARDGRAHAPTGAPLRFSDTLRMVVL